MSLFILIQPSALSLFLEPGFHADHFLVADSDHESPCLAQRVDYSQFWFSSCQVNLSSVSKRQKLSLDNIARDKALMHYQLIHKAIPHMLPCDDCVQFLRYGRIVDHQDLNKHLILSDPNHFAHRPHSFPQTLRRKKRSNRDSGGMERKRAGNGCSEFAFGEKYAEAGEQGVVGIDGVAREIHKMLYSIQTNVIVLQPVHVQLRVVVQYKPGSRLISFSGLVEQVVQRLSLGAENRYSVKYIEVQSRRDVLAGCYPFESPVYLDLNQLRDQAITIKMTPIETGKRIRQRTISQVIQLVSLWKRCYQSRSKEGLKPTLSQIAKDLGMSRKTLDDYNKHLRLGEQNGFDFAANFNKKMGLLRSFVRDLSKRKEEVRDEGSSGSSESSEEAVVEWGNSDEQEIFAFRDEEVAEELAHQPEEEGSDQFSWELEE